MKRQLSNALYVGTLALAQLAVWQGVARADDKK